jgi:hypothetical protein
MKQLRFARTAAALALAVAAITAPVAGATTTFSNSGHEYQDLRSPDTRDAAERSSQADPRQDLRSPDTQDLAAGHTRSVSAPEVTVVKTVQPASPDSGLDVGDLGIGAGVMLGLILLALGGSLAVTHRRRQPAKTS